MATTKNNISFVFAKEEPQVGRTRGAPRKKAPTRLPFSTDIQGFDFTDANTIGDKTKRDKDAKLNPLQWAYKYRKLHGRPFSLKKHKPLAQIYEDDSKHIVVMKPAQVGCSEMTLTKAVWALDVGAKFWKIEKNGLNVGYIFPTKEALGDFSKERFAGLRTESDHLAEMFTAYDDVTFKQIGNSFLYMRGATSESALLSFPADVLILDEFDRISDHAISLAQQRLRASEVKREIDISTPTIPGVGIDALYAQSDMHVWEVLCRNCMQYSEIDFFHHLRLDGHLYETWQDFEEVDIRNAELAIHCPSCDVVIDATGEGRWRAKHPERVGLRGYHVPWYAFPNVDVRKLCLDAVSADPTKRTEFYRSGLGIPFSEQGSKVTRDMLINLEGKVPTNWLWSKTTIGIDVGTFYHFRVSSEGPDKRRYVRAMGKAKSLDEIDRVMRQYKVRKGIIDALPENHGVQTWVEKKKGRMLRAFYSRGLKDITYQLADQPLRPGDKKTQRKPKKNTIHINRTLAMDAVYARIANEEEVWPSEYTSDKEVISNMTAPTRIEVMNKNDGQYEANWVHSQPDHYFHACLVAGTLIKTEYGDVPIENIRPGIKVWTRNGLHTVLCAGMTNPDAEVTQYTFTNGVTLTGTPNHPVYSKTRGYIPLNTLNYNDIMYTWQEQKKSSITGSRIAVIQTANAGQIGFITHQAERFEQRGINDFINRYGKIYMVQSLTAMLSIILMKIPSITIRIILRVFQALSINLTIRRKMLRAKNIWSELDRLLTNGTGRMRVENGIVNTLWKQLPSESNANSFALNVISNSPTRQHSLMIMYTIALLNALLSTAGITELMMLKKSALYAATRLGLIAMLRQEPAHESAGEFSSVRLKEKQAVGKRAVYNLSVEHEEEYFANEILVHNCLYDILASEIAPKSGISTLAQGAAKGWTP